MFQRWGRSPSGPQVGHRRVAPEVELGQPARAVAQPLDLVVQSLADQLACGELLVTAAVRILGRGPAVQRAQLSDRRVKAVQLRVRDDRVHARWAQPGGLRDLAVRGTFGVRAGDRPRALKLGDLAPGVVPRGSRLGCGLAPM